MCDEHERAGKIDQALFQDFEGWNVEIVGGLVEQQHISGLEHELRDQDASALASREAADGLAQLFAGEEESRRPSGDVDYTIAIDDGIALGRERAAQSYIGIERARLVKVDDAQPIGAANRTGCRSEIATQQAEQSSLAAAIRADQTRRGCRP